jgi:hypothetical protein
MPARVEDEWSDSDEEYGSSGDIETNVQLGIPDGSITAEEDLKDPRVSRIGGHPVRFVHSPSYGFFSSLYIMLVQVFLVSSPPDVSVSQCKNCSNPMQLVSQIWCPIEIVLWTARCISGLVPTESVRKRMEGTQICCLPCEPAFDVDEAIQQCEGMEMCAL